MGTIQGTVTDPTGAVVPGASVTATNIATRSPNTTRTTAAGLYVLSPLPPGRYNLQVTASGFQPHRELEGITVDALATIGLDVTLKVGTSSEQVTVEATAPMLRTEDVSLGQTMENSVYNTLPLAMSSGVRAGGQTAVIALAPGVAAASNMRRPPDLPTLHSTARSRKPTACTWKA